MKEYAALINFPTTGETNKIYVTQDTNKIYRWTGSAYIEVSAQVSTADAAVKLSTPRTIALSGDVTGSVSFDGSADVSISAVVGDNTHDHMISNVTGLQTALDGKAASSHTHSISDVTNLQTTLDGKAASTHNHDSDYADINHNHDHDTDYADINHNHDSDYAALSHNHDSSYAALSHTHTIANVTGLQTALDGKASSTHNHDSDYADISHNHDTSYAALSHSHTIANVTGLQTALDAKAASTHNHDSDYAALSHTHTIANVTGLQTALDGKASSSHTHAISDVTNLQTTLDSKAASTHNHDSDYADIDHNHDADYAAANHNHDSDYASASHNHDSDYAALGHTHTIANVTGLQTALDGKAASSHSHSISDVTNLQTSLDGKAASSHNHDSDYAALSHTHTIANVSGLQTALDGKAASTHDHDSDYAALSHSHTIANVTGLQTALDGKSSTSHNHDTDYADINHNHDSDYAAANHNHDSDYAAANHNHDSDYAAASHTHSIANVTGLQTALDGKAASSHNHDSDYAASDHNHDADYAAANHNHDSAYQAVGTGVLSAGTYGSTSNQQKIDTITLDAEGHVTGIVTDDSTTLHTMHDDHGNTRHLRDYEHFKFSDASGIDVTLTTTASGSSTDPHILTIGHADTSSQTGIDNNDNIVIQSVGLDGFGHVTDLEIKQITPALIGAAASAHNHDGTYLQDVSDDTSPTLGGALDANSNSITGITNLSANSLVLASGGSLISSASWAQNGSVSLTGMGTTGLNITSSAIGTNVPQIKFSDTGNGHEATIGFAGNTANVFKIEAENQAGTGQYAIIEKDSSGNLIFRDASNHSQSRLTTNNIWQLGYTGAHNGTDLVNGNDTGFQVNGSIGQAVVGSTHATAMKIASTGQTSPTMIHFYKNGSTTGTIKVSSSGTTAYNTTSDLRVKTDIEDISNGLKRVCSLSPKSFKLLSGDGSTKMGLIAQDIDDNIHYGPAYVSKDDPTPEDPDPLMSLDYSNFVPDLIAAVKELSTRINELEKAKGK